MPTITIDPAGILSIDGVIKGHFLDHTHSDAVRSREGLAATDPSRASLHADIKAAFDTWHVTQRQLVTAEKVAHNATKESLDAARGSIEDVFTAISTPIPADPAKAKEWQDAIVASLTSHPVVAASIKARRLALAQKALADAQSALAAIQTPAPPGGP